MTHSRWLWAARFNNSRLSESLHAEQAGRLLVVQPHRCFMLVGKVLDTFEVNGRGLVAAIDMTYEQMPRELKLRICDPVELRLGGEVVLQTKIVGIEHCDPWSPKRTVAFLLPRDVSKAEVPIGSEVWFVE